MKLGVFLFIVVSFFLDLRPAASQGQNPPISNSPTPIPLSSPTLSSLSPGLMNSPTPSAVDFGDSQPTPGTSTSSQTLPAPSGECYIPLGLFGVRVSTDLAFFNLADFNANQAYLKYHFIQLQAATPSDQYQTRSYGPDSAVVFEAAPFYPLTSNLEVGINFDYWAFTPLVFDASDIHPQYFHDWQRNLSSLELNVFSRLYFLKTANPGPLFFLEAGAGIQPMTAQLIQTYQDTGNTPSTDQTGEIADSTGFDASVKIGAAMDLGNGFSLGFKGGYQYSYATGFSGNFTDAADAARNGVPGSLLIFKDPNSGLNTINFVPNNSADYSNFGITASQVAASRKLIMDLSGLRLAADLTYQF
jgi:hypothetical protein